MSRGARNRLTHARFSRWHARPEHATARLARLCHGDFPVPVYLATNCGSMYPFTHLSGSELVQTGRDGWVAEAVQMVNQLMSAKVNR